MPLDVTLEAVTLVTPRSPVEELKVKLLPLLGATFPVASVANNGKQVVSLDSSATVMVVDAGNEVKFAPLP